MKTRKHNLTLGEVLILIVILSLAAVYIPLLLPHPTVNSRKISCLNSLRQIGLSTRMYSMVNNDQYPYLNGRSGLQMLADEGFLENTNIYMCPSTTDKIDTVEDIQSNASYSWAGGLNEADSVDSALASDRANNHDKFGNILFIDGHVKGYAGSNWSSNRGKSILTDFK